MHLSVGGYHVSSALCQRLLFGMHLNVVGYLVSSGLSQLHLLGCKLKLCLSSQLGCGGLGGWGICRVGDGVRGHTSLVLLCLIITSIFQCISLDLPNVVAKSPVQAEAETLPHPSLLGHHRGIIQE